MKQKRLEQKIMKSLSISVLFLAIIVTALLLNYSFSGFAVQEGTFNLEVQIPSSYKELHAGENIHFTTKILNLGGKDRMDISLKYEIFDSNENVIASKTETMAIETQASFVGELHIPESASVGNYELSVTLLADNFEAASGKESFAIIKEEDNTQLYIYVIVGSVVVLALIIFLLTQSKKIIQKSRIRRKIKRMIKKKGIINK